MTQLLKYGKIKTLTIISQPGIGSYDIGKFYNGMLLDRIVDNSVDSGTSFTSIYAGFTEEGDCVFEAINAPIEIVYDKKEEE